MDDTKAIKASEVSDVECQQLSDTMNIHASREPGVMDLHPLDVMRDQKRPPTVVNFPAVREEFEVPFDHAGQTICFGNTQTKTVLVERAS